MYQSHDLYSVNQVYVLDKYSRSIFSKARSRLEQYSITAFSVDSSNAGYSAFYSSSAVKLQETDFTRSLKLMVSACRRIALKVLVFPRRNPKSLEIIGSIRELLKIHSIFYYCSFEQLAMNFKWSRRIKNREEKVERSNAHYVASVLFSASFRQMKKSTKLKEIRWNGVVHKPVWQKCATICGET